MLLVIGCRSTPPQKLIGRPTSSHIVSLEVVAGLPRDKVKATLNDYSPEITACFQSLRPADPIRLVLKFTIESNGSVRGLGVEGRSKRVPAFESCVLKAVQRIRFPKNDVPALTEVPSLTIDFYPAESDEP